MTSEGAWTLREVTQAVEELPRHQLRCDDGPSTSCFVSATTFSMAGTHLCLRQLLPALLDAVACLVQLLGRLQHALTLTCSDALVHLQLQHGCLPGD